MSVLVRELLKDAGRRVRRELNALAIAAFYAVAYARKRGGKGPLPALLIVMLAACAGGAKPDGSGGGGGLCPAELAGESAQWTHVGSDPECVALAGELNQGLDLSGGDDGCSGGFEVDRASCSATLEGACNGIGLSIACDVDAAGAADCTAVVTSAELSNGSCAFDLQIQ